MSNKNNKKTKITKYLVIGISVLIIILLIGRKAGWFGGEQSVLISTDEVSIRTITEIVTASGKIQPETEVKISPDVSGEIVELKIKEGDFVERGQFLLKIKPDIYESAMDRANAAENSANANLANARARVEQVKAQFNQVQLSFNRNKALHEQGVISQAEFETIESQFLIAQADVKAAEESVNAAMFGLLSAQATVKEAKENLRKTSVFAPMNGTISLLNVEIGERVVGTELMAGTEMMRIANLNSMEVTVDVNENDIIKVKLGDSVDIYVDAYLNRTFYGVVTEIANSASSSGFSVDQVTNFKVKIRILPESYQDIIDQGIQHPFRPGMSANVDIKTKSEYNVLAVPLPAVTTRVDSARLEYVGEPQRGELDEESIGNQPLAEVVFVYNNEKIEQRKVKTGIQDSYFIHIVEGLDEGEHVVTAPYNSISRTLRNGMKVKKVTKDELFKSSQ